MKTRNLFAFTIISIAIFNILAGCQSESVDPSPAAEKTAVPGNLPTSTMQKITASPQNTPPSEDQETRTVSQIAEPTQSLSTTYGNSELIEVCGSLLPTVGLDTTPEEIELDIESIDLDLVPEEAQAALERILTAPETVGLALFEIGNEANGIFLNSDIPMPLASVVKIINLIAYAEAVDGGELDPGSWIELVAINRYYLPRVDLGAHDDALGALEAEGLITGEPPLMPLEEVPGMMIRFSSNAAADYIQMTLGQEVIESTAISLGLDSQTAPCPWIGQFLIMANHERIGSHQQAVENYIDQPELYGEDVLSWTKRYTDDDQFRNDEIDWRRRQPAFSVWKLFTENLNARGSASDYAQLMSRIATNDIGSPYVNLLIRRELEWPTTISENQETFAILGFKGGALPGVLTSAYYGQRLQDGKYVVAVLFFRDLPRDTYQRWLRNQSHDAFARWMLSDPNSIPFLRDLIIE